MKLVDSNMQKKIVWNWGSLFLTDEYIFDDEGQWSNRYQIFSWGPPPSGLPPIGLPLIGLPPFGLLGYKSLVHRSPDFRSPDLKSLAP